MKPMPLPVGLDELVVRLGVHFRAGLEPAQNSRPRPALPIKLPAKPHSTQRGTRTPNFPLLKRTPLPIGPPGLINLQCPEKDSNLQPPGPEPGALSVELSRLGVVAGFRSLVCRVTVGRSPIELQPPSGREDSNLRVSCSQSKRLTKLGHVPFGAARRP